MLTGLPGATTAATQINKASEFIVGSLVSLFHFTPSRTTHRISVSCGLFGNPWMLAIMEAIISLSLFSLLADAEKRGKWPQTPNRSERIFLGGRRGK